MSRRIDTSVVCGAIVLQAAQTDCRKVLSRDPAPQGCQIFQLSVGLCRVTTGLPSRTMRGRAKWDCRASPRLSGMRGANACTRAWQQYMWQGFGSGRRGPEHPQTEPTKVGEPQEGRPKEAMCSSPVQRSHCLMVSCTRSHFRPGQASCSTPVPDTKLWKHFAIHMYW